MASTVWKGHLTFGLVSIPIKLTRAARAEKVSFRHLHGATGSRVRQTYVPDAEPAPPPPDRIESPPAQAFFGTAPARPAPIPITSKRPHARLPEPEPDPEPDPAPELEFIPRTELVKGFEYEKNRYVVIEKSDLAKITPKTATEMQILEFVRIAEVDPIFFETSYYVSPAKGGEKPYALLFEAMRKSGYVAVAQFAMHNREHVVIIRPGRRGIILHTMFYTTEIRDEDEFRTSVSLVAERELELAGTLIEALAAPFEPEKYRDTYKEQLEALIAAKVAGEDTVEPPAPKAAAPVPNMIEALQRSLESMKKPAAAEPAKTGDKRRKR